MLAEAIKLRGLGVLDESALPDVWRSSSWEARELFAHLLSTHNSVIYYYLGLKDLELPNLINAGTSEVVEETLMADAIIRIAQGHAHKEINEVHALAALIQLVPWGLMGQFKILSQARRIVRPDKRVDKILEHLYRAGQNWMAHKLISSRERSHLGRTEVIEQLEEYMSSVYYPFGVKQWLQFENESAPDTHNRPNGLSACALKAFAAHRTRELKRQKEQEPQ